MKNKVSFWRFPIVWMIAGAIGIVLINMIFQQLTEQGEGIVSLIFTLVMGFLALLVYKLTLTYLAGRPTPEISRKRAGIESVLGMLTGTIFIAGSAFMIIALGGYSFQWASSADTSSVLIASIESALAGAIVEELIFRGLMLQAIDKLGGKPLALAVTSLFFGVAHLGNPGATLWSGFAIALEAGVLLGSAFLWRRNLWFAIGLHFAWNAIEGLLGIPVSGHPATGLFTVKVHGAALLTGGNFGLETSIVPVVFSLLISIPMLIGTARNQRIDGGNHSVSK
ncbi:MULTISPECIES: CPBP family intramembrane glutamic endopeptidase [unclassified Paenibacillus]|uniref:CPBP family intramembrane glutamic endopeptidase n=1 Tax=unclassified Paenibacillus TaxID=185978 RepID=UPI000CF9E0C9|nr:MULTISPECIES: type II CAAX endopeptidase family protein [unclassified Paenibacillus]MBJ9989561.1 CPBP family intramembrane metalloprotease [Paenibacillus sp. S28]PQP88184.1 CPBP family intramembrane metalloprotease [Paenibacillus sp. AR247]